MSFPRLMFNAVALFILWCSLAIFGYPAAYLADHGFNPAAWPHEVKQSASWWFDKASNSDIIWTYFQMALGAQPSLNDGGWEAFVTIVGLGSWVSYCTFASKHESIRRDTSGVFGHARFATDAEIARCDGGLELGIHGKENRPVRFSVEGNLCTIAPSRSGKTTGLILTNLAVPDRNAWMGPAIVVDPKGEVFRATRQRRQKLGRTVRCIDPFRIGGGKDAWNPFDGVQATDIARLQGIVKLMLPSPENSDNQYFIDRATEYCVAGLIATSEDGALKVRATARLVQNVERFSGLLYELLDGETSIDDEGRDILESALQLCNFDPKTRDPIVSTAVGAFGWARDPAMLRVTDNSTFSMVDLCACTTDLYIVPPADERAPIIAPYIRMMLGAIMHAVRENRPKERIVAFVDEAFVVLGKSQELVRIWGEMPGHGLSLWLFFQSYDQIEQAYGAAGARILLGSSAVTNMFALARTNSEEAKRWSDAIGDITFRHLNETMNSETGKASNSETASAAPLVPPGDIAEKLSKGNQFVFVNDPKYTKYPLYIRLGSAITERRFSGLVQPVAPTARLK